MKLETKQVAKVWGRSDLPRPFVVEGDEPIGEIWFEPPPELPDVLVKYLFTSEKLSVQVHPSDADAPPGSCGKDECWLVLDAEPDSRLAIGFSQDLAPEAVGSAARDGSIEELLDWHPVAAGDFFYLPAGTVHVIGAGLTILEVQQNSDITYRLYDYGRPRELHLEKGLAVSITASHPADCRAKIADKDSLTLVDGPFFRLSQVSGAPSSTIEQMHEGAVMVLPLEGHVRIGSDEIASGEAGIAGKLSEVDFSEAGRTILVSR